MRIEHLHPAPRPRIEHSRGRRGRGSNRSVLLHATDRTPAQAPKPRIEHLRRRSIPGIETLWSRRTHGSTPFRPDPCHGSTPFAGAGRADRHPSGPHEPADRTLAGRADRTLARSPGARIEHLRGLRGRGSRPFGVAGRADRHPSGPIHAMDRHPSRAPGARIDTLPVRSILRIEHLPDVRIEHLHPAPRPRGSNTCPVFGGSDRTDPVCSIPRIETLRSRRTRGSTPFRPDPCHGSTPLAGAGRADRHPSGPREPADRTLAGRADRTLTRPGGVRIEHLHPAPRPRIEHLRGPRGRGSKRSGPLDPVDRDPSESPGARIDTLPAGSAPWIDTLRGRRARGSRPFQSARTGGSNTCARAGDADRTVPVRSTPRIDTLRGRRSADRHPSAGSIPWIDTPFAGSIPWIEILRHRRGADRRPSRSPAGASPGGRPAGLRSPRSDLPPCGSPPGSTALEPRNTK